jgi:dTDP-4-amino-4,6-dideoxygalactose transaminase
VALSKQPAFAASDPRECPVAVAAADALLSLPISPRLTDADAVRVAREVGAFAKGRRLA